MTALEFEALQAASVAVRSWLPDRKRIAAAKRLAKRGLLKECGISVVPPHTLYVITDAGRTALAQQ